MAKIANVQLTDTFNTWRVRSNESFDRLSQFALTNSALYANTITANVFLKALGGSVLGTASRRTIINGLSQANGNFSVTGNTFLGAASKRVVLNGSSTANGNLTVAGNTTLGAAGKTQTSTGVWSHTGNQTVSGNSTVNKLSVTSLGVISGNTVMGAVGKIHLRHGKWTANGYAIIVQRFDVQGNTNLGGAAKHTIVSGVLRANGNLVVVGNTTLGGAGKTQTSTGSWSHTGNMTVSANLSVSGLKANGSLGSSGQVLKTNGTTVYWGAAGAGGSGQSNVFSAIAVSGQNTLFADDANDTLNIASGWGITITTTIGSDTLTIRANNTLSSNAYNQATYATKANPTTSGLLAHTGRATVSTSFLVSGNTKLGAAGKKNVFNGASVANGTLAVTTNLSTTGNTSTNKLAVTTHLRSSGNTFIGAAGKTSVINGVLTANGRAAISTNLSVSGNTTLGAAGKTQTSTGAWTHTGRASVSTNLTVSGNTTLGGAGKTQTSTGVWSHTGRATISTNLTVSGNTQVSRGLGVGTTPGTNGSIRATNDITAYYSDERLKIRIKPICNAVSKINTLSGFYFRPNEIARALGYKDKLDVGVSAQEINAILPEVIAPAPIDDKYMTVKYERLVPLLIEAIKELSARVEELEKNGPR